ncbi:hypothetical protein PGH07_01595 [Sulfurovum sp. zt1-1]|uniref:Uncharacterized protein n=1 Tax=Sulfurovum zhangzhouensis TaxID=3019067 RepID=A0ABT7QVK8_9BACT|nr:hypothetical protein [Sulfurovum zhangzhouensis]MDM5270867.1 hypothetical protein [Sulfurovum zhangzhouensis]
MFYLGMHFPADMGNSLDTSVIVEKLDAQVAELGIDDINVIELEMGLRGKECTTFTYTNKDTFMFKALAAYLKDDTYVGSKEGEKYLVYTNRYQIAELSKKLDSDDETMALCKVFDSMEQFRVKAA